MTAFGLALLPAGTTLSLDAWLRRQGRAGAPIRLLYSGWGAASTERAQVARLLPLLAYAAISLASALQHLHEPEWRAGEMVGLLMLLPVMNPSSYEVFGWFSQRAPDTYRALSAIATYGMLAWQVLMIPLLLTSRYTRLLATFWGISFFIASEQLLNIKMLGGFEYVLWALIFINIPGRVAQSTATIFFDDRCNLCDRTVRTVSFIDVFRTIEFAPLSKNIERMRVHGVTEDLAQTDMVGVFEGGTLHQGYDLYLALSTRVLFLAPFWPLLKLGTLTPDSDGDLSLYRESPAPAVRRLRNVEVQCAPTLAPDRRLRRGQAACPGARHLVQPATGVFPGASFCCNCPGQR